MGAKVSKLATAVADISGSVVAIVQDVSAIVQDVSSIVTDVQDTSAVVQKVTDVVEAVTDVAEAVSDVVEAIAAVVADVADVQDVSGSDKIPRVRGFLCCSKSAVAVTVPVAVTTTDKTEVVVLQTPEKTSDPVTPVNQENQPIAV